MIQGYVVGNGNDNANVYAEPVNATVQDTCTCDGYCNADDTETEDLTKQFKGLFDAFAESLPQNSHQEKSAKGFFKKFSDYIGSNGFKNDLEEKSEKYQIPKKQLAKNFFLKILGIIGDILGVVINTVCNVVDTAISLLSMLLHGAVDVIAKVGNGLARVVSCNQTCVA